MFVERVFQGFDLKQNDVIDFDEFVRALSIFHPSCPLEEKAACEPPSYWYPQLCTFCSLQLLKHGWLVALCADKKKVGPHSPQLEVCDGLLQLPSRSMTSIRLAGSSQAR